MEFGKRPKLVGGRPKDESKEDSMMSSLAELERHRIDREHADLEVMRMKQAAAEREKDRAHAESMEKMRSETFLGIFNKVSTVTLHMHTSIQ